MAESLSSSRRKTSRGSAAALDRSPLKPPRSSFDNVGEREMKVLSLVPAEAAATIGVGGSSDAPEVEPASRSSNGAQAFDSQRSIPIVDTETPGKVTLSMRAAGVTVVTYLGRGDGSGLTQKDPQDTRDVVVTLTETSAREIEGCAEIDAVRGKFSLGLEAATIQLLDKSLMQVAAAPSASAETASTSPLGGAGRHNRAPRPQLMMVGPVGVEVASTRYVRLHGEAASRPVGDHSGLARYVRQYEEVVSRPGGDDLGSVGAQSFPATPMTPTPGTQSPSYRRGVADTCETSDGRDRRFWDALGSWPMWDWRGRLKIGAYTAELGKCNDRPGLEEVWRRFRFSMPKSALEDTQVLRRGLTSPSCAAQSSTWLLKAGARGLAVDVQIPFHEQMEVARAPSPKSYVYVSSSESDTGSPPVSPPSSRSSRAANREENSPSTTPSRLFPDASAFFPDTAEECAVDSSGNIPPHASFDPPPEGRAGSANVPADSSSISELSENDVLGVTPSNAELLLRVQELQEELEALRTATAAAPAATGVLGSSTPIVAVDGGDTPQT